jgi:serine/threonine-protein kinase
MEAGNLGKYQLGAVLGRGAIGTVYEGWDPVIERRVAIKAIRLPDAGTGEAEEALARFRREAQTAGRLIHPNVVGVFDCGKVGDVAYLVMEFVEGRSLKSLLNARERLPLPHVLRVMEDVLAGLEHSHAKGVVHRDIKPANIMLTPEGRAKIADFGIARLEDSDLTQTGMVLGTPAYMSPEQFMGEAVDARSDLYAAGVVLYELLTGKRPFAVGTSSGMQKALQSTPPRPSSVTPGVPPTLDAVVARAMARRPQDRYPDAATFASALRAAMLRETLQKREATAGGPASPRSAGLLTAALFASALLTGGLWLLLRGGEEGRRGLDELRRVVASAAATVPCALVSGDVVQNGAALLLDGLVSAREEASLRTAVSGAAPDLSLVWRVTSFDGPYCDAVELLRTFAVPFGAPALGLAVATADGRTHLQEGDPLQLRITAPGFHAHVQLDYLQNDGTVYHMQPSAAYPGTLQEPGSQHGWGEPRPDVAELPSVQPPFGADMIIAIAAPAPLLPNTRPEIEPTDTYLRDLRAAIEAARARDELLAGTALILVISPRR